MQDSASNVNPPKRISGLEKSKFKPLLWPAVIILSVVLADQMTKIWAVAALTGMPSIHVLGNFLMFTLVYNDGGALGTSFGPSKYYLVSSSLILLFVLFYLYQNRFQRLTAYSLAFIAGGAVGNIIDRIRLGRVVDFIDVDMPDFNLFGYHLERWWTFNLADAAISCSIVFLLVHVLFFHRHEEEDVSNEMDQARSDSDSTAEKTA